MNELARRWSPTMPRISFTTAVGAFLFSFVSALPPARAQGTSPEPALASSETSEESPGNAGFAGAWRGGNYLSALGLHLTLGLAFGGEKFATLTYDDGTENSVRGGEGVILSGGLTFTPLWIGDSVGLGLGVDAGWKYKSTSVNADASVALTRFPIVPSARALVKLGGSWHLLAAGGLVLEMSPSLQGDGLLSGLDIEFDNGTGGMGELGILWGHPQGVGYEITGRYTFLEYTHEAATESLDASSGSLHLTLHYFL
jgi:hypothetical protein